MSRLKDWKNTKVTKEVNLKKLVTLKDILRNYYKNPNKFQEIVPFYIYWESHQLMDKGQKAQLAPMIESSNKNCSKLPHREEVINFDTFI